MFFRNLEGHREPGQDEAVGKRQGRLVDGGSPADDQLGHAIGAGEVKRGRDRAREAMGR